MIKQQLKKDVVIIGAGPAGLGCAALLKQMGIQDKNMLVLDTKSIGSSFISWPKEMRLITPSFPSNGYHQTDLNAITPDTSPAFNSGKEHLSGEEYAAYLRSVVNHYNINVWEETKVIEVQALEQDSFQLKTNSDDLIDSQYIIWAGGEFNSPSEQGFIGSQLCLHNSKIQSWDRCDQDHYVVIGSYESGVDAAYNLAIRGKKVTLLDASEEKEATYDPSRVLSPYTAERLRSMANSDLVELKQNFRVDKVVAYEKGFTIVSKSGHEIHTSITPINCTGFQTNLGPVHDLFEFEKGFPLVNKFDESTIQRNLFLAGPKLVHGNILLCFIYKFRGRFATVCSTIGAELGLDTSILPHYQQAGMLLDDFACCEAQECFC